MSGAETSSFSAPSSESSNVAWGVIGLPSERIVVDQKVVSVNGHALKSVRVDAIEERVSFLE
jgi:hypothetical protein